MKTRLAPTPNCPPAAPLQAVFVDGDGFVCGGTDMNLACLLVSGLLVRGVGCSRAADSRGRQQEAGRQGPLLLGLWPEQQAQHTAAAMMPQHPSCK